MGYTTDFWGQFGLSPALSNEQRAYLTAFASTRRMKRNEEIADMLPDPIREAVGLPIGTEGAFFVGSTGMAGQDNDASVTDYNEAPGNVSYDYHNESYDDYLKRQAEAILQGAQPGLWCQWIPDEDGTALVWDEGEKFYKYVEWIHYIIENFLKPWGIVADGEVTWQGEETEDAGMIRVVDNVVTIGTYTRTLSF